jgi:hypothetical protein
MRELTYATPTHHLTDVTLTHHLDELAAFEPNGFPVVSLYLDTRPDDRGRDNFDSFVRKEFAARARSFAPDTPERASFESDAARIRTYPREELRRSARLRRLRELRRTVKLKGLTARQLMERRTRQRQAAAR